MCPMAVPSITHLHASKAMGQIHSDSGPNQPERTEGNESKFSYMHNIPPGEGTVQGTICADK